MHGEHQYVGGLHSVEERKREIGNHRSGAFRRIPNERATDGVFLSLSILGVFPVTGKRRGLYDLPNGCLRQHPSQLYASHFVMKGALYAHESRFDLGSVYELPVVADRA